MQSHRLASRGGLLLACVFFGAGALASPALAHEHENFVVATPFEVGDSPSGNYLSAIVAGANRDTIAAATFFAEALRFDPHNRQLLERTFVAALSNGNMREAMSVASRLLSVSPHNGLARLVLGIKYMKAHQYAAARAQFRSGGAGQHDSLITTLLAAWAYAGSGNTQKALAIVDTLQDQNLAVVRDFHKALIAALGNDVPQAIKSFQAAYKEGKKTLHLVDAYARFMSRHGHVDEAIHAYKAFDQLVPNNPIVQAALAKLEAGKTLAPVVKTAAQGAAEVLYDLGTAGSRQGQAIPAMVYLRLSLYLHPKNSVAIITLADIYERVKQYGSAIDVYQTVPHDDPLRLTADIETANALNNFGRRAQAMKYLKKIVKDHPDNEAALYALANLQSMQKDYADAASTYTRALAQSKAPAKANWALYYFRGICYDQEHHWPLAEADFKHALQLRPNQPAVLNYLGYSWVAKGIHLKEAYPMLKKAVELRPTDGYIVDSLGWADYKLGHYHQAVKELERAVNLKPADAVINEHLGDAYWRVGRRLEARFQWNHARDFGPSAKELPKILQKIKHGLSANGKPASAAAAPSHSGG